MFSKRKPEAKASVNMMYSADEVENLVMEAIKRTVTDDCDSDENGGSFAMITLCAGAMIMTELKDILKKK